MAVAVRSPAFNVIVGPFNGGCCTRGSQPHDTISRPTMFPAVIIIKVCVRVCVHVIMPEMLYCVTTCCFCSKMPNLWPWCHCAVLTALQLCKFRKYVQRCTCRFCDNSTKKAVSATRWSVGCLAAMNDMQLVRCYKPRGNTIALVALAFHE